MKLLLVSLVIAGISALPHNIQKKAGKFPLIHEDPDVASLTDLKPRSKKWHIEPMDMNKISKKSQNLNSVSKMKESHSVFSSRNGNRESVNQENTQVSKNGKLSSKIFHQEKANAKAGGKPHVEELSEVEIPELDIHEKIVNNDGVETTMKVKRSGKISSHHTPSADELAGYVIETGDQASVVKFLEMMIRDGKMSEEEALVYVETIKSYIDEAERASEQPTDEEEKIREILLERNLEAAAIEQRMEEEAAAKAAFMRNMHKAELNEDDESESILKMNKFLGEAVKEGKISRSLYNHLKGALVESVVEGLKQDTNYLDSVDYGQY